MGGGHAITDFKDPNCNTGTMKYRNRISVTSAANLTIHFSDVRKHNSHWAFFSLTTSEANLIVHFSDEHERNAHWWLAVIAVLPFFLPCNNATHTINSEHINGYIEKVVDEFERNPKDGKYLNVINSPLSGEGRCDFFLPKIFMWSPQEQFPIVK